MAQISDDNRWIGDVPTRKSPVTYKDFTPIATMCRPIARPVVLVVNAESPTTLQELSMARKAESG